MDFSIMQVLSAFMVLFAIIDPLGSIPIVLNLESKGEHISAIRTTIAALIIMFLFLFAGEWVLNLFNVDIQSFAIAGAIIIFIMALEMVCDIEIFKNNGPEGASSIVPLAFPLFAGPGVFAAVISLRAEYDIINICIALLLNMAFVYVELRSTRFILKIFGETGIYIIRKFFGIVLLAIAVKLFATNISSLLHV